MDLVLMGKVDKTVTVRFVQTKAELHLFYSYSPITMTGTHFLVEINIKILNYKQRFRF